VDLAARRAVGGGRDHECRGRSLRPRRGKHLADASFTAQWGTGSASAKIVFDLTNVFVESIVHSGGGATPTESLSLAYGKIRWTYTDAGGNSTGGWDIENNSRL